MFSTVGEYRCIWIFAQDNCKLQITLFLTEFENKSLLKYSRVFLGLAQLGGLAPVL